MVRHQGLAAPDLEAGGKVDDKRPAAGGRVTAQKVRVIRYLASAFYGGTSSRMNDKGVLYALEGRFREAEIMFRESLKDDPGFAPACNNLAVVYEIFGRGEDSFDMYSRACIIEPDNDIFRENFLNLSDSVKK
jgi:tetratricopeptide (TPR) repeat protein